MEERPLTDPSEEQLYYDNIPLLFCRFLPSGNDMTMPKLTGVELAKKSSKYARQCRSSSVPASAS